MSNPGRRSRSGPRKGGLRPERQVPEPPIQGGKRVAHPLVVFGLIVLVFGGFGAVSGGNAGTGMTIPDPLVGIWKTTAPNYAGRFFQITKDIVVFSIGDGQTDMHPITNVDLRREEGRSLYTISYLSPDGEEYKFPFYYEPADDGLIRFKNQQRMVWKNHGRPLTLPELIRVIEEALRNSDES